MVRFALLVNLAHALRQNYAQEDASERERKVRLYGILLYRRGLGLFMQITSSRHFSSTLEQIHVFTGLPVLT